MKFFVVGVVKFAQRLSLSLLRAATARSSIALASSADPKLWAIADAAVNIRNNVDANANAANYSS